MKFLRILWCLSLVSSFLAKPNKTVMETKDDAEQKEEKERALDTKQEEDMDQSANTKQEKETEQAVYKKQEENIEQPEEREEIFDQAKETEIKEDTEHEVNTELGEEPIMDPESGNKAKKMETKAFDTNKIEQDEEDLFQLLENCLVNICKNYFTSNLGDFFFLTFSQPNREDPPFLLM